jgi:DNA-binding CsgD family transcriptional regulator
MHKFKNKTDFSDFKKTKIRVKIPSSPQSPDVMLTEREAECLKHALFGRSYKHIGRTLGLSPRTVEFYISNMRVKFNCTNRYQLIEKVRSTDFLGKTIANNIAVPILSGLENLGDN